jgi:alpha-L-fucosidase
MFKGEKFDAEEWLDLFEKAGAKYIIPVAEHHDGFAMWDSELTNWDAKDKGPKRDIIGELEKATRKRGLKFAPSIHRERHNTYYQVIKNKGGGPLPAILEEIRRAPEAADLYGPFEMNEEYMMDFLARWEEICDKYKPDFYWLDDYPKYDEKDRPLFMKYQRKLIADYINRANNEWGKEVYFNNKGRNNNYPDGVGIREFDNMHTEDYSVKWQNPATLGVSYGYRKIEEFQEGWMKPPVELVHLLIEVVAKNGNLLLNVGPRPDGTIPEVQQAGLLAIGEWLKTNGEAIFNTRVWKTVGEERVRFTANGDRLYAIMLDWPKDSKINLKSTSKWKQEDVNAVKLLGGGKLKWIMEEEGLSIELPSAAKGKYAYALEISCKKDVQELPAVKQNMETEDLHQKHKARIAAIKDANKEEDSTDYK